MSSPVGTGSHGSNASKNKTATPATEDDVMALEQLLKSAMEARQAKEVSVLTLMLLFVKMNEGLLSS